MLSITDEISMVGFKQFQSMNQIMCTLKGTTDGNWGDICVLKVKVKVFGLLCSRARSRLSDHFTL